MPSATSFALTADSPTRVARAYEQAARSLGGGAGGLVFVSGTLSAQTEAIAKHIAQLDTKIPTLVVSGAGIVTERGEVENETAAAGIVWSGGRCSVLTSRPNHPDALATLLGATLDQEKTSSPPTVLTFLRPDQLNPTSIRPLQQLRGVESVFGAGTIGDVPGFAIASDGQCSTGGALALLVRGLAAPHVRVSPACRLLTPLSRITECRGSMVLAIEDEPALDVLSAVGSDLQEEPLVVAVLADKLTDDGRRPELLVRAVQGVDPVRGGLLISEELRPGMWMAFAVRDARAARADLDAVTRQLQRDLAGAHPLFGIYINCTARGSALYGTRDVDSRMIRERFANMPFAGLKSSFEIAPYRGKASLHLYCGVLALFTAPS
jgi:small ligand-binding sensory domain FIST